MTLDDHKQYFHDIAVNAKGITKSLTTSFDRRSLVNRVAVEIAGQLTKRKEDAFKEASVQNMVEQFLDALVESFPELEELSAGDLHPVDLRDRSLLGSATILRTLAGAYHLLAVDKRDEENPYVSSTGDAKARALFEALAGRMGLPIEPAWFDTGYFPDPTSKAPSSRAQDLKGLTALIARWGETGEVLESDAGQRGRSAAADAWA